MKKVYSLVLAAILAMNLSPIATFAKSSNQNLLKNQVDYAELIKGQDIKQLLKNVEDYKLQNPKATENELSDFFKKQVVEGSKQSNNSLTNENQLMSITTSSIDYTGFLPTKAENMGPTERAVFNDDAYRGAFALADADYAINAMKSSWSDSNGYHNDNADAFRHSLWNALMAKHCGTSYAERFANAHETDNPNPDPEKSMDLYNNSVGRSLGVAKSYDYSNAMAVTYAITTDTLSAVKAGQMRRFVGGDIGTLSYLVNTNSNDTPAPPPPPQAPAYPGSYIKYGSTGSNVVLIQNRLNTLGFNCGAADGMFGNMTKNAVISFQRSKGLSADGIVGPTTWYYLFN